MDEMDDDLIGDLGLTQNVDTPIIDNTDDLNIFDNTNSEKSLLDELLESRGIKDNKIKIIEEDNTLKDVNFSELSREEQLEILNSTPNNFELNDLEKNTIEKLRLENITFEEYLDNYKKEILSSIELEQISNYDIDAYDDNELFLMDLKAKYDLSEEELSSELQKELQNEEIFKKKIDKLRSEYKQLEDQYKENQLIEIENKKEEDYNQFSNTMVNVAIKTSDFYGIELDEDEKEEVLSHILDIDNNGVSDFYKSLNDPQKLYELAWFSRYGKDAFEALKNAYESEISKIKKDTPNVVKKDPKDGSITSINNLYSI